MPRGITEKNARLVLMSINCQERASEREKEKEKEKEREREREESIKLLFPCALRKEQTGSVTRFAISL
jgi:hypothetical protein